MAIVLLLIKRDWNGDFQLSTSRVPVNELRPGERVQSIYLLDDFQLRPRKDGGNFMTLVLRDATGKVTGVMWDNFLPLTNGTVKPNDYVQVLGDVLVHQNQMQIRVAKLEKVADSDVSPSDFLPVSPIPIEQLEKDFWQLVDTIKDEELNKLVRSIFEIPRFWKKFRQAPSAVSMHQAYLGGLIEHTVGVTKNALKIAKNYPSANVDIILAGALLHDIGKTVEFSFDKKIAYTDMGRLIGHIPIGFAMIEFQAARLQNLSPNKKALVQHIVLSHHGYLEFGSPKQPHTVEALIVHHADQLDAQLSNCLEQSRNMTSSAKWEYRPMFERYMFAGSLDDLEAVELLHELGYSLGGYCTKKKSGTEEENASDLLNGLLPPEA